MPDYSNMLTQIASSLQTIANAPNITWLAPIATLAGAAVGYWASQHTIKKQKEREATVDLSKKQLVFQLLRDEITLRWKGVIEPFLQTLAKYDPLLALQMFSTTQLRGEDVFVFKSVATSFQDYYYLRNDALVSEIIHGYLLVCDLIDLKAVVVEILEDRKKLRTRLKASLSEDEIKKRLDDAYSEQIKKHALELLPGKLHEINNRFDLILAKLSG